jgi:hypothetical protein
MTIPPDGASREPTGTFARDLGLGVATGLTALVTSLLVARRMGLSEYEIGFALGQTIAVALGAGVLVGVVRVPWMRALAAIGGIGLAVVMTFGVVERRTALDDREREPPAQTTVAGEVRLVHGASGMSVPALVGLEREDASAGPSERDRVRWVYADPSGGTLSWSLAIEPSAIDDARFAQLLVETADALRARGVELAPIEPRGRDARIEGTAEGHTVRARLVAWTSPSPLRHWVALLVADGVDAERAERWLEGALLPEAPDPHAR